MKVLITARPGVGKSYITEGMQARGLSAFDLEEIPGIIRLAVRATGEPAEWPDGCVDWDYYAWRMQAEPLQAFLDAQEGDIYVSCSTHNQANFYHLFDKVIILTLESSDDLRQRIEARNAQGRAKTGIKTAANIDRAVSKFMAKQAELVAMGGIPINNNRPRDVVIDDIIQACQPAVKS